MEYFLSLGAGPNQLPLILKCREMGIRVISIDNNPEAIGFHYSNLSLTLSILDYESIFTELKNRHLSKSIMAVGCRSYGKATVSAAYISEKLGLRGIGFDLSQKFLNKGDVKAMLQYSNNPIPKTYSLEEKDIQFPCILKPKSGSGKMGVQKIYSMQMLDGILPSIQKDAWILEQYIEGSEVTVLGFMTSSNFHLISISDKITTTQPPFLEKSHRFPSIHQNKSQFIHQITANLCSQLGLKNCPIVAEFKITPDNQIYLIEIVPEIGGEFLADYLVPYQFKYDYFSNYIQLLCTGEVKEIHFNNENLPKKSIIYFIVPPEGLSLYISSELIEPQKEEAVFLDKELKQRGTLVDSNSGNSARVRVIGASYYNDASFDTIETNLNNRIGAKFVQPNNSPSMG